MTDELVHLTVEDGVATITLDSPANRNALSAGLRAGLRRHLDRAVGDRGVRVVVLTHAGPVFCSGMDLKEPGGPRVGAEIPALMRALWTAPKPVLARLAGPVRAGGVGLMASCDVVLAADAVTFGFSEVRIGAVPATISAPVLRRMDPAAAAELMLTGERFDAARAAATGLITKAVPAPELDAEVDRYVGMLRLGGPGALAGTKELLRRDWPDDAELAELGELSQRYFGSAEAREGIAAFVAKRPPSWAPGAGDRS